MEREVRDKGKGRANPDMEVSDSDSDEDQAPFPAMYARYTMGQSRRHRVDMYNWLADNDDDPACEVCSHMPGSVYY